MAEILKLPRFSAYQIAVEEHAVRICWYDEAKGRFAEQETLYPPSLERARVVQEALASLGVAEARMTGAGFEGTRPVVPHSDIENRWKNRRVESILRR